MMYMHRWEPGTHLTIMSSGIQAPPSSLLRSQDVWLMAFGTGGMVASIYYIQPLLASIATSFRISVAEVGGIAMLSQLGTALGMLVFVPLGDTKERRSLIVLLALAASICLVLMATARERWWLVLAAFGIGLTAAVVHVIVPYAAHLAPAERRGSAVGFVLSGLLFGILLARTLSGLLAAWLGWRSVYWLAAIIALIIAGLFQWQLPRSKPPAGLPLLQLLRSALELVWTQPVLRESALLGAVFFSAFSAFWTTLVFFLQTPPYHYGSAVAGLFGLVGVAGAVGAPVVGKAADRRGPRGNILIALASTFTAFVVMYFIGTNLAGLIAGVVLLDFGVQAAHVTNQTRIYSLLPDARSRLNMVYMICYFTAGALGSYGGTVLWEHFGWDGVCGLGAALILVGAAVHAVTGRRATPAVSYAESDL
jgi:predicted MFS family arabinose efflux permease